jgi:mannosyl-oligosaccharide glucosidase
MYCDFAVTPENDDVDDDDIAMMDDEDDEEEEAQAAGEAGELQFVCHAGYVSLFPLFARVLRPDSEQLRHALRLLSTELWSDYGLLSLAPSDEFYGSAENYWRSNIWINMNYMACAALHHYGATSERAQELYTQLRTNLIRNIAGQYATRGYLYEQYDAATGRGRKSHPFAGWTALIANIVAETY